jgi:tyrosine-protein kinase Etk/Wzc
MAPPYPTDQISAKMNAPYPLQAPIGLPPTAEEDHFDLLEYWDIIADNRWLVFGIAVLAFAIGGAYALLAAPIYEANLLVQVEDTGPSSKSFLGEASSLVDIKTPAAAEMEILRSRMVLGRAVDSTSLYTDAQPHYLPVVGGWLARRATELSEPGFLGFGGFVTGTERIAVAAFDVPSQLQGTPFTLVAGQNGRYTLSQPGLPNNFVGTVGTGLTGSTAFGSVTLLVTSMAAKPGAEFILSSAPRLATITNLQNSLRLVEKGRQSGIIEATLLGGEPGKMTRILNEIGRQYVRQNVERKAAEAENQLAFLKVQMPQFKRQLDQSDQAYSRYRNQHGTVAPLDEEAKLILTNLADLQGKLMEAKQKRLEVVSRFTSAHPAVKTLDEQIAGWSHEVAVLNSRISGLPAVQQDALRLERDVKINNDAYQNLRNSELQLELIREGKVGNVRVIDEAVAPQYPVQPRRGLILSVSAVVGVFCGILVAFARNAFFRGIRNPQEIEALTGLSVYSTIPLSHAQDELARLAAERQPGIHVLATRAPNDPAVESLRSLRTALQFAMLEASNNRVLVTGATPGVGKSFVSANFAVILANAGKRVLLIDADLRKGHLNHFFGVERNRGLSELVAGSLTAVEAIRRNIVPNLDLLTTGVLPPNPAELMMSGALAHVLDDVSRNYDFVIVDAPPVLVAADTLGIAPHAGTVLLVARSAYTQVGELHEGTKRLAHAGKTVSGVLFNAMDLNRRHYGSYGYRYGGYRYRQYNYVPGA